MITVERVPEPGLAIDVFEWSLLVPVPGFEENTILFEQRDGDDIRRFTAEVVRLGLGKKDKSVLRVERPTSLFITDARVAIACSKFDKGGGWIGGPVEMLVFNTASKARAAWRSRGTMMVGQIRYPWLENVGSTSKIGRGSAESLVFDARDADELYRLSMRLPDDADAASIAAEIARRAAAFRLATENDHEDEHRVKFEALVSAEPMHPSREKNEIRFFRMPTYWRINEKSARLTSGLTRTRRALEVAAQDRIQSAFAVAYRRRGFSSVLPEVGWSDGMSFGSGAIGLNNRENARVEAARRGVEGFTQVFVLTERHRLSRSCVVCEAYDLELGTSLTVVQQYTGRSGKFKADGVPEITDSAESLPSLESRGQLREDAGSEAEHQDEAGMAAVPADIEAMPVGDVAASASCWSCDKAIPRATDTCPHCGISQLTR